MDRSYTRIYVYACPEDQHRAVLDVLDQEGFGFTDVASSDAWGVPADPDARLCLTDRYVNEEFNIECGGVPGTVAMLTAKAPGASFVMWSEATYAGPGDLAAHTPSLGTFHSVCENDGSPTVNWDDVSELSDKATSRQSMVDRLRRALGRPWMDDWDAAQATAARARPLIETMAATAGTEES